jgi:hypothetical protein
MSGFLRTVRAWAQGAFSFVPARTLAVTIVPPYTRRRLLVRRWVNLAVDLDGAFNDDGTRTVVIRVHVDDAYFAPWPIDAAEKESWRKSDPRPPVHDAVASRRIVVSMPARPVHRRISRRPPSAVDDTRVIVRNVKDARPIR